MRQRQRVRIWTTTIAAAITIGVVAAQEPRGDEDGKIDPAEMKRMEEAVKKLQMIMKDAAPAMEKMVEAIESLPGQAPPPDDGVARVVSPFRTIDRPPVKCDLSVWAGRDVAVVLPHLPGRMLLVDEQLRGTSIPVNTNVYPATGISPDRGFFLKSGLWAPLDDPRVVLRVEPDTDLREVLRLDPLKISEETVGGRSRLLGFDFSFFEWGDGYGVLCVCWYAGRGDGKEKEYRARVIQYDVEFVRQAAFDVPGLVYSHAATGAGPGRETAVIMQDNAFVFMDRKGACSTVELPPPPSWTHRIFGGPISSLYMWTRYTVLPDSTCFVMPRADRRTLPVFDMTATPPSIIHTFEATSGMTSRPAAVAAGRRVFYKEDQGNTLAGWEFDGSRGRELWSRFIRITENKGQAYLGYHEGNVIVPGRGNIYFVNADNGWVNYRFSAVVPAGEAIIPENDWFREAGILGLNPQDVMSYAIFNGYLIGCVRDRKKPIYVWKLPDPLVPRGT